MEIQKIMVAGSGLMGAGISQVIATAGINVAVRDVEARALSAAGARIEASLERAVKKKTLREEEAGEIFGRISFTQDIGEALNGADFVIEAVPEELGLKRRVFEELDRLASPGVILATNTSQLRVGSIAGATRRPAKVIGTHWFNPATVMRLIEVVRGELTSDETVADTLALCARLGKETVVCKDCHGFIANRIYSALMSEALRVHAEGVASIEDIDKVMRLGYNLPMGPFELIDMAGVDVIHHGLEGLNGAYGDRFGPSPLMKQLVEKKEFGRKSGKGFYRYR